MFRNLKIIAAAVLFALAAEPASAGHSVGHDEFARGAVGDLTTQIQTEAATRAAQDAAEEAARIAADTAEAAARAAGDTALQTQIDAGTIGGLSCFNGQVAKFNGAIWVCSADQDTDTDTSAADCPSGQILVSDGLGGTCVELPTLVDPGPPNACPVFNAAMVDAAAMVAHLLGDRTHTFPSGLPSDRTDLKFIRCEFTTDIRGSKFLVSASPGPPTRSIVSGVERTSSGITQMVSFGFVSNEEFDACREQVLLSFVWNQYCAPFLP